MNIYGNVNLNINNTYQSSPLTQVTSANTLNLQVSDNGSVYSLNPLDSSTQCLITLPLESTLPPGWNITIYNNGFQNAKIVTNPGGSAVLNYAFVSMTISGNSYCNIRLIDTGIFSFSSVNPFKILTFRTPNIDLTSLDPITPLCNNLPTFIYDFVVLSASVVVTSLAGYTASPTMSIDLNGAVGSIAPSQQFPGGAPTPFYVYNLSLNQTQPRCIGGSSTNNIVFNVVNAAAATTLVGYCMVTGYVTQNTFPNNPNSRS